MNQTWQGLAYKIQYLNPEYSDHEPCERPNLLQSYVFEIKR